MGNTNKEIRKTQRQEDNKKREKRERIETYKAKERAVKARQNDSKREYNDFTSDEDVQGTSLNEEVQMFLRSTRMFDRF